MTKAVKETAALAHIALDEVERLRAKVTSLERELAEAKAKARTPGTVEVCSLCEIKNVHSQMQTCPALLKRCPVKRALSPAAQEADNNV